MFLKIFIPSPYVQKEGRMRIGKKYCETRKFNGKKIFDESLRPNRTLMGGRWLVRNIRLICRIESNFKFTRFSSRDLKKLYANFCERDMRMFKSFTKLSSSMKKNPAI